LAMPEEPLVMPQQPLVMPQQPLLLPQQPLVMPILPILPILQVLPVTSQLVARGAGGRGEALGYPPRCVKTQLRRRVGYCGLKPTVPCTVSCTTSCTKSFLNKHSDFSHFA